MVSASHANGARFYALVDTISPSRCYSYSQMRALLYTRLLHTTSQPEKSRAVLSNLFALKRVHHDGVLFSILFILFVRSLNPEFE